MQHCLIISRSARALAESGKKSGYYVHAVDAFADRDMTSLAGTAKYCSFSEHGFDMQQLTSQINKLIMNYPIHAVVVGTGIERQPHMLAALDHRIQFYCNSTATINTLVNPFKFKALLQQRNILMPDIYEDLPTISAMLLRKRIGSMGGEHVMWIKDGYKPHAGDYFQAYVTGKVYSVAFLADGTNASIVGFNKQWQNNTDYKYPFVYAGAHSIVPKQERYEEVNRILQEIVSGSGLKGLCGMDYIVNNDKQIVVLEVNPRPPATFELHEGEQPLFAEHIRSFAEQVTVYHRCHTHRAHAIIYANKGLHIVKDFEWPSWVKDIPACGRRISSGKPVCTVHAEAESISELKQAIIERKQIIKEKLYFVM